MNMKLLEGFNLVKGNLCTPCGFALDTFDYQLDCSNGSLSILMADNLCTVACECSSYFQNTDFFTINEENLIKTKGISQAIIITISKNVFYNCDSVRKVYKTISNELGLYDENILIAPMSDVTTSIDENFNILSNSSNFAVKFDICGIDCYIGVLKYQKFICITTDVAITHDMLKLALKDIYRQCFNGLLVIMASGQAGNMAITKDNYIFNIFKKALNFTVMNLY